MSVAPQPHGPRGGGQEVEITAASGTSTDPRRPLPEARRRGGPRRTSGRSRGAHGTGLFPDRNSVPRPESMPRSRPPPPSRTLRHQSSGSGFSCLTPPRTLGLWGGWGTLSPRRQGVAGQRNGRNAVRKRDRGAPMPRVIAPSHGLGRTEGDGGGGVRGRVVLRSASWAPWRGPLYEPSPALRLPCSKGSLWDFRNSYLVITALNIPPSPPPKQLHRYCYPPPPTQGCMRREGASEAVPEAVRQAVGGGAKAVGGGYCRLQMPLKPALGVGGQWLGVG